MYRIFKDTTSYCFTGIVRTIDLKDFKLRIQIGVPDDIHPEVTEVQDIILYLDESKLKAFNSYYDSLRFDVTKGDKMPKFNFLGSLSKDTANHILFYCTQIMTDEGKEVLPRD